MVLEVDSLRLLDDAVASLEAGFADLPPFSPETDLDALGAVLGEVAARMRENYPYPHPLYAGQMLKPPHPVARLAYMLALWINPNNHALDGGRASSAMEKVAVAELAGLYGWADAHLGHLTSGGTVANLEALWIASRERPGEVVVASEFAHYTHSRISGVLGIPFRAVPVDAAGRMDPDALEAILKRGGIGTVVATLGTTGIGSVDPLAEIVALRERYGFRLHVDAAYGGYFGLTSTLDAPARAAFTATHAADSIVVDPHKHGLQPYGCGCVLFRDPSVGRHYRHDSPYTYFTSDELHLGEISLECSRAGAAAVALWATQRLLPPVPGGAFALGLERCRAAALALYDRLGSAADERTLMPPELDIVVWAPRAASASETSRLSTAVFRAAADRDLHLATVNLPVEFVARSVPALEPDRPLVTCLRSCLMKPEHLDWVGRIWDIYARARGAPGGSA